MREALAHLPSWEIFPLGIGLLVTGLALAFGICISFFRGCKRVGEDDPDMQALAESSAHFGDGGEDAAEAVGSPEPSVQESATTLGMGLLR
jgi:hypothetical protein